MSITTNIKREYEINYNGYIIYGFQNKRRDFYVTKIVDTTKDYVSKIIPPNNCSLTLRGMKNYAYALIKCNINGEFYTGSHFNY